MIAALVQKDIRLFFRNQFFALITALGLVFYLLIYFLLPADVEETLPFAVFVADMPADVALQELPLGDGLAVSTFDSEDALIEAVRNGDYMAGLALSAETMAAISQGEPATLNVYYAPGTPPEMRGAVDSMLGSALNAHMLPPDAVPTGIDRVTEVLGLQTDGPLSMRDRVLPSLVLLILAVEVMGLATLIVEEIEHGTAQAILTTPLGTNQFFASKAIMGIGLAFVQVFLISLVSGVMLAAPLLITLTLLLGCLLITGFGFIIAAVARDMMSVMAWGMMGLIILTLPSLAIVFPTIGSGWMDYIPSHYLIDTLHRVINAGATWGDVSANLLTLLVIGSGTLVIGSAALWRRFV
jgi:ABC-2 type transport system permease protein